MADKFNINRDADAHAKAMRAEEASGDPTRAAAARCFQAVTPALVQWMNDERQRGTSEAEILFVVPPIVVSLAVLDHDVNAALRQGERQRGGCGTKAPD